MLLKVADQCKWATVRVMCIVWSQYHCMSACVIKQVSFSLGVFITISWPVCINPFLKYTKPKVRHYMHENNRGHRDITIMCKKKTKKIKKKSSNNVLGQISEIKLCICKGCHFTHLKNSEIYTALYGNAWGAPIEFSFVHFVNFLFFYCQLYKNSLQKIRTMSSSFLQRQISVIILKSSQ